MKKIADVIQQHETFKTTLINKTPEELFEIWAKIKKGPVIPDLTIMNSTAVEGTLVSKGFTAPYGELLKRFPELK